MITSSKIVYAPINNKDMDTDLDSKTVYIFDYDKSVQFKEPKQFLDYINHLGIISDIYFNNTNENIRFEMLEYYMSNTYFNHITSFNVAILNCIYHLKNTQMRLKGSALTSEQELNFTKNHKEILTQWMEFYDSYLMYMILYATSKDKQIKQRYNEIRITNRKDLSPNIVSLLLDDFFYDYYKSGIGNNLYYYIYYYDNKLYDNKTFNNIMINDANFIIRILLSSSTDDRWQKFLLEKIQK